MSVVLKRSNRQKQFYVECCYRCCSPIHKGKPSREIKAARRAYKRNEKQSWKQNLHQDY